MRMDQTFCLLAVAVLALGTYACGGSGGTSRDGDTDAGAAGDAGGGGADSGGTGHGRGSYCGHDAPFSIRMETVESSTGPAGVTTKTFTSGHLAHDGRHLKYMGMKQSKSGRLVSQVDFEFYDGASDRYLVFDMLDRGTKVRCWDYGSIPASDIGFSLPLPIQFVSEGTLETLTGTARWDSGEATTKGGYACSSIENVPGMTWCFSRDLCAVVNQVIAGPPELETQVVTFDHPVVDDALFAHPDSVPCAPAGTEAQEVDARDWPIDTAEFEARAAEHLQD